MSLFQLVLPRIQSLACRPGLLSCYSSDSAENSSNQQKSEISENKNGQNDSLLSKEVIKAAVKDNKVKNALTLRPQMSNGEKNEEPVQMLLINQ